MATPLEKRKTIFNKGVPTFTKTRYEFETTLTREFGGQPTPSNLPNMQSTLGRAPGATGTFNPKSLPIPPQYKTLQQIIQGGQNFYVDKLNKYNYLQRFNDVLAGDTRDRSEKYPPDVVIHKVGQTYPGSSFDDGFIRGGVVQSLARASEDINRISRFLVSGKGVLWIAKQQGLQMTNPRPETRLYNPATTLLQTAYGHTGLHLTRHGLNPFSEGQGFGILDFGYNTYSTVKDYEPASRQGKKITGPFVIIPRTNEQSKLLDLVGEMHFGDGNKDIANLSITDITNLSVSSLLNQVAGINVSKYTSPRDKAAGGPEINTIAYQAAANAPYGGFSIFGGGIHRSANTMYDINGNGISKWPNDDSNLASMFAEGMALISNPAQALSSIGTGLLASAIMSATPGTSAAPTPNADQLKTYKSLAYGELGIEDFKYMSSVPGRNTLRGPSSDFKTGKSIFPKIANRKESLSRLAIFARGMADPGTLVSSDSDMTAGFPVTEGKGKGDGELTDCPFDLVPLIFYDIKNDQALVFRALLSAITDTITPEWNEYNYIGNPQTYYTYKRTTRDFGFTFKIYTETEAELKWNWMKLNRFVGMLYPSYTSYGRMVGPFLRLTIGDMLYRTPGYMSALSITIDDNTPWELNLFDDDKLARLPHVIECAVTFRVVGDKPLEGKTTPFYAQNKMYDGVWNWNRWIK